MQRYEEVSAGVRPARQEVTGALPDMTPSFHDSVVALFDAHFQRLYRYLNRLSGEPELAARCRAGGIREAIQERIAAGCAGAWLIT